MKQKLISVLFLVLGPILLVGGFLKEVKQRKLEVEGVPGFVTIADKSERSGKRGKVTYHLVMKPRTLSGPQTDFEVSREMYDSKQVGDLAAIKYLETDLDDYILLGKEGDSGNAKLAGLIVTLAGALGTWWFFFKSTGIKD